MIHCPPLPAVVNAGKVDRTTLIFFETRAASVCWKVLQKAAGKKPPEEAIRSIARAYLGLRKSSPRFCPSRSMTSITETEADAAHVRSWRFVLGHIARPWPRRWLSEPGDQPSAMVKGTRSSHRGKLTKMQFLRETVTPWAWPREGGDTLKLTGEQVGGR
jgi:hypothetical protein